MANKAVVVTGGNSGIGYALCKQLAAENGCRVFMGSRSAERGEAAVKALELPPGCRGSVELLVVDVSDDASVAAAAKAVRQSLGEGGELYGLVNNAGIGLAAQAPPEEVVNVNLYGVKRMCGAFLPLLSKTEGRIVNVGSGAGPMYVEECSAQAQKFLCNEPKSWEEIEGWVTGDHGLGKPSDKMGGYGVSKALLSCYTMLLAKEHPEITVSCVSPGFINTKLTAGFGAPKPPEEGTVSIRHCLFEKLDGNGWYYGSDAIRSPYHFMRNPREPAYDGVPPC